MKNKGDAMKRLWISEIILSIFLMINLLPGASVQAQEPTMPNRGAGTCWQWVKDKNGVEIIAFNATTEKCGWFTVAQRRHDTAGSNIGWNGYIKIANVKDPSKAFYLGVNPDTSRSLKFGKGAQMACFICNPEDTNCSPNNADPCERAKCFVGKMTRECPFNSTTTPLDCSTQVDCSRVIDITECYSEGEGVFSKVNNDLQLCNSVSNLENYGTGSRSYNAQLDATTQAGTVVSASSGMPPSPTS